MSSPDPRAEQIFDAAVQFTEAVARRAYLDRECASDAGLRREVESLLAAHDTAGTFLENPAPGAPLGVPPSDGTAPEPTEGRTSSPLAEKEGDRIGRYKLLEKIGTGGFGDVWMAEQEEPVRRRVALKIIKLGMDTREIIARFEAERQALALMDHPNIAKVHDGGTTDTGRPYFVMELVRGIRITDYCDQNGLPTVERLKIFMQVCQAVQHAHQKGIIHRDLKPSNILVTVNDGVPVPKVIDFGIAKATEQRLTDKTVFTRFMQFLGTPAYMSPEQAELTSLDIDTRSDIYSLGVLLYELLTGRTPFDAKELLEAGLDEMRRTIREKEPVRPSTRLSTLQAADLTEVARRRQADPPRLIRLLRGDLDLIVMQALEKDRTRRYETANAIVLDICRHLADEPVSATTPSAVYRFGKFARRNKTAIAVAGGIAAILFIASVVSTWQAILATRAGKLAKQRLIDVAAERDQKDKARQEAEAISTFFSEVFQSPDPKRAGRTITVAESLDRAARKLQTDLAIQTAQRVKLQATLGVTYFSLGLDRDAIPLLETARDYYLANLGPGHHDTLKAMQNLANAYSGAGRRGEALKLREEVLTLRRKVNGLEHLDTLDAMDNVASSYHDTGRVEEALKLREEALVLRRKVNRTEHPDTLVMANLAASYHAAGRREEALRLREEVLKLRRKEFGPEQPQTIHAMRSLAISYYDIGRREEALKLREEGLVLSRKVLGPDHHDTLATMNNLALSYYDAGRREEAFKLREELLSLALKVNGPEHPDTLWAMNDLAISYHDSGRGAEALKLREEVLVLRQKVLGLEHRDTLVAMNNLALSYYAAGRREEALKLQEEVLSLSRKLHGPEHPDTLLALNNVATSYQAASRREEALKLREEVLSLSRKVLGPEHRGTLNAMGALAVSYHDSGRREEALKLREEWLVLSRKVLGPDHHDTLWAMSDLALSYHAGGRREEAFKLREELLSLALKVNGPVHPDTLWAMNDLAISYQDSGRGAEALKLQEEVLVLRQKVLGLEHPDTLVAMNNLALSYYAAGRREEALRLREEVLTLRRKEFGPEQPQTIRAMRGLAISYHAGGRREEALKLREEGLVLSRKVLGPDHPDTLCAMNDLAVSYHDSGRREEALKLREEGLVLSRKVLGPDHPDTCTRMNNLAISYHAAGRRDEALKLREEVLALSRKTLGLKHPDTLTALHNLAESYHLERDYADAEPLYRDYLEDRITQYPSTNDIVVSATVELADLLLDWAWSQQGAADKSKATQRACEAGRLLRDCLDTRVNILKPASSRLAETRSLLGHALVAIAVLDSTLTAEARLARFTEAESLLLKGHEALRRNKAADPKHKRDALERLVRLYEAWDKPEQLAEWRAKLKATAKAAENVQP